MIPKPRVLHDSPDRSYADKLDRFNRFVAPELRAIFSEIELNNPGPVLDAGCGNGRYTYWAAKYGGTVIGVDLGDGVESARKNTRNLPDVQIVQGDLFHLPFRDETFDIAFSIGVLMHTGNARAATEQLTKKLKPGGSLSVRLYGRGNVFYEQIDAAFRRRTTKMSIADLQKLTGRLYSFRKFLERLKLAGIVGRFVRLDPHPHCIFDWYAAPVASHHTYPEVNGWFQELGLRIADSREAKNSPKGAISKLLDPMVRRPSTVTMRGLLV